MIDYGNVIWYPFTKKNKKLIEYVRRHATRLDPELYGVSYTERLSILKLFSLKYRRERLQRKYSFITARYSRKGLVCDFVFYLQLGMLGQSNTGNYLIPYICHRDLYFTIQ